MTLEFAKTAPGVSTATWTDPKKAKSYSVAIIESCDTWHTFIDGELIAREVPSFDDAVAIAESRLKARGGVGMVRVAAAIVVASMLGASAVVATKFLPATPLPAFGAGQAASETHVANKAEDAGAAPALPAPTAPSIPAGREAHPVILPAVKPATVPIEPSMTAAALSGTTKASDSAASAAPRRFSAANSLLAQQASAAKVAAPPPAAKTEPPPVEPQDGPAIMQSAPAIATGDSAPEMPETAAAVRPPQTTTTRPEAPHGKSQVAGHKRVAAVQPATPLPSPYDPAPEKARAAQAETDAALSPPLPAQAPSLAAPIVHVAISDIEAAFLNEPGAATDTAPAKETARRTVTVAPLAHKTQRQRPNTRRSPRRPVRTTAAPTRRLVCFAHICRWQ